MINKELEEKIKELTSWKCKRFEKKKYRKFQIIFWLIVPPISLLMFASWMCFGYLIVSYFEFGFTQLLEVWNFLVLILLIGVIVFPFYYFSTDNREINRWATIIYMKIFRD
jgi:hypothetical protein